MNFEPLETQLPAEVETQLDHLLVEWRTHRQLDPTKAETIRQAILKSPAALPDEWWQRYVSYLNRVLHQANRASQNAVNQSLNAVSRQWPWLKPIPDNIPSRRDWQPYLKLA